MILAHCRRSASALGVLLAAATSARAAGEVDLRRPGAGAPVSAFATIGGGEALEWGGTRLAAGDVNGDGIADLVAAAPGGTEDRPSRRGRLYVFYGSVALPSAIDRTLRRLPGRAGEPPVFATQADVVIEGWDDFDHLGRSLAVADLDADGFADIVAGAPRADGPRNARSDCGEVYVIHGASSLPHVIDLSAGPGSGARVNVVMGRAAGDALGTSLAVADLDDDGLPDVVAGAPLASGTSGALGAVNVGEVVVVRAGPAMPPLLDLAAPPPGAIACWLRGADAGDQAGSELAAGDFDGDGVADLAVGARGGDGPLNARFDSGEVYLVLGGRRLAPSIALGLAADAFIAAPDIGDGAGGSLAFGDVDGDSRADLAIGGEQADGAGNARLDAGDIWLLAGRACDQIESLRPPPPPGVSAASRPPAGPVLIELGAASTPGVAVMHGTDPGDHAGVRAVVDLDRDGFAEVVIGAEDSSSRRNTRAGGGEIRILPGGPPRPGTAGEVAPGELTIFGGAGGGHFGKAVAAADLNGDGRPELIVSAPQAGQSLAGTIMVLGANWKDALHPPVRRK